MPTPENPLRRQVLELFRRGQLATAQEGAWLAVTTRQAVTRWLREERIDARAARLRYIATLRSKAARVAEGKPTRRRTKADLRREGERAVREFNKRQKRR